MSPRDSASASRGSGTGRGAITALIVVAVVIAMVLLVRAGPSVPAFDPRSSAANGANGVVLLLQQEGATVTISSSAPAPGSADRVFVIADRLDDAQRRALLDFVGSGGIAVVADPASSLHGGAGLDGGALPVPDLNLPSGGRADATEESNVGRGDCTIAALQGLRGVAAPAGVLFPTPANAAHCFDEAADHDHSFVIVRPIGQGTVVGFGDNDIVTNQFLEFGDNAGLVTALLAPHAGSSVRVMIGSSAKPSSTDVGQGNEHLLDLVRPGVWMGLAQLMLAFIVFCFARAIRPGRAVREPLPTPIAGSELVAATGNLMQRARHAQRAGWLLRGELYRQLRDHYCLPAAVSIEDLAAHVSARTDVPAAEISALLGTEVDTSDDLLTLTHRLDAMRSRATQQPTAMEST